MLEEHKEEEQGQRRQHNSLNSRNIFDKKKNMFARVKEAKTRPVEQRRHDFSLPQRQLKDQSSLSASYIDNIYSTDERTQYSGLLGLREIFIKNSQQEYFHFDTEIIPRLIEFSSYDHIPYFQHEAAWILSAITYGNTEEIRLVLQKGVFPYLKKLLISPLDEIKRHIIRGIGNMAIQSTIFRDILLHWGMLELLVERVHKSNTIIIRKDINRGILNLCRGDPLPDIRLVRVALLTICNVIKNETDEGIVTSASRVLKSLVNDQTCINTIINSGVIPAVIKNLKHPEFYMVRASIRILGKLLMGSEEQTHKVLCDPKLLPSLTNLLSHSKKTIRKDTCWLLTDIAANSSDEIEKIINTPQCLSKLFYICQNDDNMSIKREAFWVLSNMTHKAKHDKITLLLQNNLFNLFISNLNCSDEETVVVIIQGLINILKRENLSFEVSQHFRINDVKNGWRKIQELGSSPNELICKKSVTLAGLFQKRFTQILT